MPKRKKPRPVYFNSLGLENVRCFGGRQELDLTADGIRPARWTLILGENGVGKTTLLQCLAWMLPTRTDDEPPLLAPVLLAEENGILEALLRSAQNTDLTLDAQLSCGSTLSSVGESPKGSAARGKLIKMGLRLLFNVKRYLEKPEPKITPNIEFDEPLVVVYGANRQRGERNLTRADLDDSMASSRLSEHTELYDVEQILSELDHASLAKGRKGPEHTNLERLKNVLARILPGNFTADDIRVFPPDVLESGELSGPHLKDFSDVLVPFSALSLGYQTTLAWTADFAWRLMNRYPESQDPLAEPAVVLIDEICLHLHPLWQLEIIDRLSTTFERTQFVATAHSPLMVQVAAGANLALLRKQGVGVVIENNPEVVRSWRVDQILVSELFGVPGTRDPDTEEMFRRRDELLDKQPRDAAEEAELQDLRLEITQLPTARDLDDQMEMDYIRKAAALLKKYEDVGE